MLKRFSEWMHRVSVGWVALLALVVFIAFTTLVLPGQASNAAEANGGAGTPDLSFYYSPEDLNQMAEAYGERGRADYIRARFTFDLVWPLIYTAFLVTALSWLTLRAFSPDSRWQRANLAPVLGMLLDFLENISTSLVMLRYPDPAALAAWLAPLFTMLKWTTISVSFLLLLAAGLAGVWGWFRRRGRS